jgi:hypothetical protein
MLAREDYRLSWEKKLAWYRSNGIPPVGEAKSGAPQLVTTVDSAESGLDLMQVKKIIATVCGGQIYDVPAPLAYALAPVRKPNV